MKFKCDQCGAVFADSSSCPVCGVEAEALAVESVERKSLPDLDRENFWQEVKYSSDKPESDR